MVKYAEVDMAEPTDSLHLHFAMLSIIPTFGCLLYGGLIMLGEPLLERWLIEPSKKPSREDILSWVPWLVPNIFLPVFAYMIYTEHIFRWGRYTWWDFFQGWCQIQLQEIVYYFLHRAQHEIPFLYQHHKTHHSVKCPRALSLFVHGVVDTWINFCWTFAGPLLVWYFSSMKIHAYTNIGVWTWNLLAGAEIHSALRYSPLTSLTFLPTNVLVGNTIWDQSIAHYHHHIRNVGDYGSGGFMDHLFGTDKAFLKWKKQMKL